MNEKYFAGYKGKVIHLTAPLKAETYTLESAKRAMLLDVTNQLANIGLTVLTPLTSKDPSRLLVNKCDVVWVLLLDCHPTDQKFFNDLKEIYAIKPPREFSLLTYPDLEIEPVFYHSKFLTVREKRKLVL